MLLEGLWEYICLPQKCSSLHLTLCNRVCRISTGHLLVADSGYSDACCHVSRYLAGVIPMARLGGFMRLLWFASHGNIFVRHVEIEEPVLDPHTVCLHC